MMTTKQTERAHVRLKQLCERLYDARTSEAVRRDLSMTVSVLRARLGAMNIDQMLASAAGEEEC